MEIHAVSENAKYSVYQEFIECWEGFVSLSYAAQGASKA